MVGIPSQDMQARIGGDGGTFHLVVMVVHFLYEWRHKDEIT